MGKLLNKYRSMSVSAKASIAYIFANFVSKGINIITIPIFTRIMSTADVGIGTTYSSWYTILYAIVTLSLCSGSMNIAMVDYKDRREDYQSACLTLSSISGFSFLIFTILFLNKFSVITTLDKSVLLVLMISLIINPALDFWYVKQRYEYKYVSSVIVTITVAIASAIISVCAVFFSKQLGFGNLGNIKVISQSVVVMAIAFIFFIHIMCRGSAYFDMEIWKYAITLSAPLIVHSLAKNVLDVSDRLMIAQMCGKSEAGIYGTVYSLAMISLLVWNAINTSLIPVTFEKLEEDNYKQLNKVLIPVIILFGVVTILVSLLAPEILKVLTTSDYYSGVYLVSPICAGVFFTALYNIYGNLLLYKKKTFNIMIATLSAAVLNIILNYFFITAVGYVAAAYTTWVSFILLAVFQGLMVRKVYKERVVNDSTLFVIAVIVSILCLVSNVLYNYMIIRYVFIVMLVAVLIIKRKKILSLLKI